MKENDKNCDNNIQTNENDLMNYMLNNDSEDFRHIKSRSHTLKAENMKKIGFLKNYSKINENEIGDYLPFSKIRRCNSVDIYKKRIREKKMKNELINNNKSVNEKNDDIKNFNTNDNNLIEKNDKKIKRVSFPNDFVTIIDVESYKKFNQENTCQDPYENIINNANNNNLDNKNGKKGDQNGKEKVVCSCLVF